MDFFTHQEKARRRTTRLVLLFMLGVAVMVVTLYLVFAGVFLRKQFELQGPPGLWNPELFAWISLGTLAIIGGASLYKTIELGQGGSVVASALGGEPVDPHTRDPDQRKLLNVIAEMSIASGVPMPAVYVMPGEKGINAFAAGTKPDNAVIGVTEGCIRHLNRDELQGVMAHEFSHILNGDMRLNIRLMGFIFGLICIMLIGRVLLEAFFRGGSRRSSSNKREGNPLPFILIAVALLVIGWLGSVFGRLIQAAVSRQREYLADASAVQFTRNPSGLSGALRKIGGLACGSKLESAHAGEASHLFFSNGLSESWFGLTATHPPLEERIRRLDPSFDGQFPVIIADEEKAQVARHYRERPPLPNAPPIAAPPPLRALIGLQAAAGLATKPVPAREAVRHFTAPTAQHLEFAANFQAGLPPSILTAAADPLGASALVFGLLLPSDPAARPAQLEAARALVGAPAYLELIRLDPDLAALDPSFKLPLALFALPALRLMAPVQFLAFEKTVADLVQADQQIDLFEFALQKIVLRHLEPQFKPARPVAAQYYAMNRLRAESEVILSALAHVGHQSPAEIQDAFRLGAAQLREGAPLALKPLGECSLSDIDEALDRLNLACLPVKKELLNACAHVVAADGVIQWREAELLRAIADTFDCPVPPFLMGV